MRSSLFDYEWQFLTQMITRIHYALLRPRGNLCTIRYIPIEKKYKEFAKKTAFFGSGGTR